MRFRYLGLAIVGCIMLGAWIAASQAAAQPKAVTGAASRLNLSLEQQDLIAAWYNELGKIKRNGLDALKRGDCRAVDSSILKAGIVTNSAKIGEGKLGTLPIFVREQIAAEGRGVAKTLSVRCGNATGGTHRDAGGNSLRRGGQGENATKGTKDKEDNVLYAINNFFVNLGPTQAPRSRSSSGSSRRSVAGNRDTRQRADVSISRRIALYLRKWSGAATAAPNGLPNNPVLGIAYQRDDGTAVADPDPFIRSQLILDRYSIDGGDGDSD